MFKVRASIVYRLFYDVPGYQARPKQTVPAPHESEIYAHTALLSYPRPPLLLATLGWQNRAPCAGLSVCWSFFLLDCCFAHPRCSVTAFFAGVFLFVLLFSPLNSSPSPS